MFGSGDFFYKLTKKLTKPKNFRASRLGLGNFYWPSRFSRTSKQIFVLVPVVTLSTTLFLTMFLVSAKSYAASVFVFSSWFWLKTISKARYSLLAGSWSSHSWPWSASVVLSVAVDRTFSLSIERQTPCHWVITALSLEGCNSNVSNYRVFLSFLLCKSLFLKINTIEKLHYKYSEELIVKLCKKYIFNFWMRL